MKIEENLEMVLNRNRADGDCHVKYTFREVLFVVSDHIKASTFISDYQLFFTRFIRLLLNQKIIDQTITLNIHIIFFCE